MLSSYSDSDLDVPRDVVITERDYPDGMVFPRHVHARGQFAYAAAGAITVFTDQGSWVVPPQRAIWVPAGVSHEMHMRGGVTMHNVYIQDAAVQACGLPACCQVFGVSPLLQQLLAEAALVPALYVPNKREGRIMALLLDEIAVMPPLALNAPLPTEPRLARVCRALLERPSLDIDIDQMAERAGMSRRTFTRLFRQHTGVSFAAWRQQACLLEALGRLGRGEPITRVALDLGYSSPSAFTAVFRRLLGKAPSRYLDASHRESDPQQ